MCLTVTHTSVSLCHSALPSLQQILAKFQSVLADPSRAMEAMSDPDLMKIISRMNSMGRGGGGGFGASAPAASSAPSAAASGLATGKVHQPSSSTEFSSLLSRAAQEGFPVVVDYFAVWCGPCKRIAPHVDELAAAHAGRSVFVKIDGDRLGDVVAAQGVTAFPTFKFYVDGACVETFSGADPSRLASIAGRLADEAQERRSTPKRRFVHFPLIEKELVLFKGVAYDKVQAKIESTLDAPDASPALWEPAFTSAAALKAPLVALCGAMAATGAHEKTIDDEMFLALGQLLCWPQDSLGSALHLIRGLASTGAGAEGFCAGKGVPRAGPGAGAQNVVAALCRAAAGTSAQAVAVLSTRAVANCFERLRLRQHAARAYEDVVDLCAQTLAGHEGDKVVVTSALAVMINLTVALNEAAALPPARRDASLDAGAGKLFLLNAVIETLTTAPPADAGALYRLLVIAGSLLVEDRDEAAPLKEIAVGLGLDGLAGEWAGHENANVAGAAKEIGQLLAE